MSQLVSGSSGGVGSGTSSRGGSGSGDKGANKKELGDGGATNNNSIGARGESNSQLRNQRNNRPESRQQAVAGSGTRSCEPNFSRSFSDNQRRTSSSAESNQPVGSPDPTAAHQGSGGGGGGGKQRISSIDILNENKQRQLQFKQQESFKQHLEQRQRLIQQQEQEQQLSVQTSAPDYIAAAMAASQQRSSSSPSSASTNKTTSTNPFDAKVAAAAGKSTVADKKKGFKSTLTMDEASFDQPSVAGHDQGLEELAAAAATDSTTAGKTEAAQAGRYARVAADGKHSYNYDDDPNARPFYQKDFGTILQECRASRKLVILIVAIGLLLDNMLLTSVVPIIPAYLYKLRIEKQHRELLEMGPTMSGNLSTNSFSESALNNSFSGGVGGSSNDGEDGDDDDDDDAREAELARRVNESLARAKDRFSGSFFHPRLRINKLATDKQMASGRENDDDDEDDHDDHDDDRQKNVNTDDDRAQGERQRQRKKARDRQVKNARTSERLGTTSPTSRQSTAARTNTGADDDDGDDYEPIGNDDDDDDGPSGNGKARASPASSVKMQNEPPTTKASSQTKQTLNKMVTGNGKGEGDADDNDDDDDDDDGDGDDDNEAEKWNKLRSSLAAAAQRNGNDTGALAGMCLNLVLGSTSRVSDDDDETARVREQQKARKQQQQTTGGRRTARSARDQPSIRMKPKLIRPKQRPLAPMPSVASTSTRTTTTKPPTSGGGGGDDDLIISHKDIVDESFEVGVMFASKPIVQAFANPFIGTLTNRVGFTIPMFTGFVIMFLSTLVFAFGQTYSTLFLARAIQGVGSACTSVAGMSMLADRFPEDGERGHAMAIALGGLALGVVIGPPFGGFMYEFVGKASPFIVLSFLALLDGLLQLMVLQPSVKKSPDEGASLMTLIKDPYILVAAGAITFANTGIAILEPALPLWMMDTMQAKNWEQGVAFLPAALSYLFGTNIFGSLGHRIGRWRSTMIGLIIIGCSLLLIPFAKRVDHLIIPNGAIGFAMGMVDSTMMPMLGYLVDIRHTSVYGSVYAIGDVAFCASFAFGPALSGTLVELIGFEGLIITTALICFGFAPLLFLLRDPPARQVDELGHSLQEQSALRYVNYSHLDSPDEEAQLQPFEQKTKTYVR